MPLDIEIKKRGYEIKWFADEEETKLLFPKEIDELKSVQDMVDYQPDIVLTITDNVPDFVTGLKVQIFHGFNPDKRDINHHFNIRGFFDLYCTQGPSTTQVFLSEKEKHPHFEVVETGWSKMDTLFPLKDKKSSDKPTILIASTFSHRLSLALKEPVFEEIKRLSVTEKYHFDMVLHPKLPEATKEKWQALEGENFTYHNTTNLNPLFKKADLMLSDTTSAIQEFMLTGKPIVTIEHHRPNKALIDVTDPKKIEDKIDYALEYPVETIKEINRIATENHPYTDGKSSERVVDTCILHLHKDKSNLKKKPLNLVRRYKIRKKLQFFTLKGSREAFTK